MLGGEGVEEMDEDGLGVAEDQGLQAVHQQQGAVQHQRQVRAEDLIVLIRNLRHQAQRQLWPAQQAPACM